MATAAELLKARLAKYSVKAADDTPKTTQTAATTESANSVRTETPAQTPEVLAPEISVTTDVQSTDVVIVEQVRMGEQDVVPGGAGTDLDTSNPVHQDFLQRLADVESALLNRDPLMKTHLGAIHKAMIQHEEIANLLRPEEIAKIMAAQQAFTGVQLRAEALGKSKAAASKKAAKISVGDL